MSWKKLSRRQFVAATALTSAALITAPYVRGAYAAGKLTMGFWDHWVPGANSASTELVNEWAAKEKVDIQVDFITSQGFKDRLTIAAESQAQSGHDILHMSSWWPHAYSDFLEPVNDIVEPLSHEAEVISGLHDAVSDGRLPMEQMDASVRRVLRLKQWLAEQPRLSREVVGSHRDLVREAAEAGVTLLDARPGTLPIAADTAIAVIEFTLLSAHAAEEGQATCDGDSPGVVAPKAQRVEGERHRRREAAGCHCQIRRAGLARGVIGPCKDWGRKHQGEPPGWARPLY